MNLPLKYKIERIDNNNLNDFIEIHKEVFKSKINIDLQKKKLDTAPFSGIENIGYLVYYKDVEPVAFYGVYPLNASINKKKVLIAQSGDTMTKLSHIGVGLNIYCGLSTFDLCRENQIKGVFGFPSPGAYPTLKKKLNWIFLDKIKKYSFFVPTIPFAYVAGKVKIVNQLYLFWVRLVLSFYRKSSFFEGSIIKNGQDGILRDSSFWNYKINANNNFTIKIGGVNVVFKANGRLRVGDIDIDNHTEIKPLIKKLKLLAFLTFNIDVIFCVSPGTVLDEKLGALKNGANGLPIGYLNLNENVDLSTLKFTYFDFDTF